MLPRIDAEISQPVRAALDEIGRTEDVRFSPDNRLIAIAGFRTSRCLILRVSIEPGNERADNPRVTVDDFMVITCDRFRKVHGIDFIDNHTIAVANRQGKVTILALPRGEPGGRQIHVPPTREVTRRGVFGRVLNPGSLAVRHHDDGTASLLVCNNYTDRVTRHLVDPGNGYRVTSNGVMLTRGLKTPDGIALSHDGRWIAVSNHDTAEVFLFDANGKLDRRTEPAIRLSGAGFPHGMCFTDDNAHLLVADAGAPVVHVYDRDNDWSTGQRPRRSAVVMDDDTFRRGAVNPEEGGPKGLDLDRTGSVVALTCDEIPLAFFRLDAFTG